MLPILGCVFRKTYYDAISACNRSDMVTGKDFVIDYWAKSIESAPRYTHIIHLYPHEASERIQAGKWLKVRVEGENNQDEDAIVDFYEQHRLIEALLVKHVHHRVHGVEHGQQLARRGAHPRWPAHPVARARRAHRRAPQTPAGPALPAQAV